jgi:hypothetical protein
MCITSYDQASVLAGTYSFTYMFVYQPAKHLMANQARLNSLSVARTLNKYKANDMLNNWTINA